MARVVGVDIPGGKKAEIGLTYIHGIGRTLSRRILARANVSPDTKVDKLSEEEIRRISAVIGSETRVEGDLRREVTMNVRRLMDIGSYRGLRHRKGLPAHGQRTRTNARTRKGPRKVVGMRRAKKPPTGIK